MRASLAAAFVEVLFVVAVAASVGAEAASAASDFYEIRLTCPTTVQFGRLQFGMTLPSEADAPTALFGGSPSCEAPANGGCTNAPLVGGTINKSASFAVRGSDVVGADPNTIYFSLLGLDTGGGPMLCAGNPVETLAVVEVAVLPPNFPATLSLDGAESVAAVTGGAYDNPARPVLDPLGNPVAGTNWVYAASGGEAGVKILVSPAIEANGGRDWLVKLESVVEIRRAKFGFETAPSGSYEFIGCDATDCSLAGGALGPTVDLALSRSEHNPFLDILYVVLEGNLSADTFLGDHTLLHVPNPPAPNRVTLGVLRVPQAEAGVLPLFSLDGVGLVTPAGPPFVIPGSGDTPYPNPIDLTGTGEVSEDADGDEISNDTDNCVVYPNVDQSDVGGLQRIDQPAPSFDGIGDGCQCGDAGGDGQITPAGFPTPGDPGDVREFQDVLAELPLDPDPQLAVQFAQYATARCSVSGDATFGGEAYECNIKDVVTLALAIEGRVPSLSAVCSRNTPGQPLEP